MIDIGACGGVQRGPEARAAPGPQRQVGAAERGAVDRIVDARIGPALAQDLMFDVVQRQVDAADPGDGLLPRPRDQQGGADVADRPHRPGVDHHADGQGIVEIGPIGELLGPGQAQRVQRRQGVDIATQRRAVGGRGPPAGVVDPHHAVAGIAGPARQQGVERGVVRRGAPGLPGGEAGHGLRCGGRRSGPEAQTESARDQAASVEMDHVQNLAVSRVYR